MVRCLVKNPRQRLRDIGDVRIEIDALDDVLPGVSEVTGRRLPATTVTTWLPWIVVAALSAGVVVWEARRSVTTPDSPLANAKFSLLTNWEGAEEGAEISPDGKFVAFLSDRDGEFDLWLTQVGTGHFSNLTRNIPPLASSGFIVRKLGFSGDGSEIWFNPGGREAADAHAVDGRPAAARSSSRGQHARVVS